MTKYFTRTMKEPTFTFRPKHHQSCPGETIRLSRPALGGQPARNRGDFNMRRNTAAIRRPASAIIYHHQHLGIAFPRRQRHDRNHVNDANNARVCRGRPRIHEAIWCERAATLLITI